jgi:hypothetical protein
MRKSAFGHVALITFVLLSSMVPAMGQNQHVAAWRDFIRDRRDLAALNEHKRKKILDDLATAILADPDGVSIEIERSRGAPALCQYMRVMFASDRAPEVVGQLDAVLHWGKPASPIREMLSAPSYDDGSTWFPRAKRAGYFTGCVAGVLDGRKKSSVSLAGRLSLHLGSRDQTIIALQIAERLKIGPPPRAGGYGKWILESLSKKDLVSPAALDWFELGFDGAY